MARLNLPIPGFRDGYNRYRGDGVPRLPPAADSKRTLLTKCHFRYITNTWQIDDGCRSDQAIPGRWWVAMHAAALRGDGIPGGMQRTSHGRGNLRGGESRGPALLESHNL